MDPSRHMDLFHLLEILLNRYTKYSRVLMHSSLRAHLPKLKPIVTRSYCMRVALVIVITRFDLQHGTHGVFDGFGVHTFNFWLEMMLLLGWIFASRCGIRCSSVLMVV